MIAVLAAAGFFGCIAFIAVCVSRSVCAGVPPEEDGPRPGKPPEVLLVAASVVLGGFLVRFGAPPLQIGIAAIVLFSLVASWCSDATCGIVPDLFTLVPLAVLGLFAIAQRDWTIIASAAIVFVPFAIAAVLSRGYGMGWGDAKLVALCGAALGAPLALIALTVACAAAAIGDRFNRKRGRPIAFAPYIALFTGIALPLGMIH
jgi:prepilin signal peptidase PulO-like enzyme (type II secretory pathway)